MALIDIHVRETVRFNNFTGKSKLDTAADLGIMGTGSEVAVFLLE
jgi:hypothetical protein